MNVAPCVVECYDCAVPTPGIAKLGLYEHSNVAQHSNSPTPLWHRPEVECSYVQVLGRGTKNAVALKETKSIAEPWLGAEPNIYGLAAIRCLLTAQSCSKQSP